MSAFPAVRRLGAVFALLAFLSGPALAQDTDNEIVALGGAWYSASTTAPIAPVTVAPGDLPVGHTGTAEDKRSYVALQVPEGTEEALISLRLSTAPGSNYGLLPSVAACQVTSPWQPEEGGDLSQAPGRDPTLCVPGSPGPARWSFDITPIVQRWAEGEENHGIALVDSGTGTGPRRTTFQISQNEVVGSARTGGTDDAPSETFDGSSLLFGPSPFTDPGPSFFSPIAPALPVPGPQSGPVTGPDTPATRPARSGPLPPLPVHLAVWLILPAGVAVLYVAGRGLGSEGLPATALDRLLTI